MARPALVEAPDVRVEVCTIYDSLSSASSQLRTGCAELLPKARCSGHHVPQALIVSSWTTVCGLRAARKALTSSMVCGASWGVGWFRHTILSFISFPPPPFPRRFHFRPTSEFFPGRVGFSSTRQPLATGARIFTSGVGFASAGPTIATCTWSLLTPRASSASRLRVHRWHFVLLGRRHVYYEGTGEILGEGGARVEVHRCGGCLSLLVEVGGFLTEAGLIHLGGDAG